MSLWSWLTNLFSDTKEEEPPEPLVLGAELWCPYGSEHTFLSLETDDIDINDLPKACVDDCKALDNITPFGVCYGGSLCEYKMDLEEKWENPEPQSTLINGKEIITTKSTLICRVWGQEIQAATSGQDGMFAKQKILYKEMDEKYPGLRDILLDPNGSLYLNEGMYEKAIQFIADRIALYEEGIFIPTIYDQGNVEGEMIRAALERLLPYCDTSTFDRFINGLENAAVRNDMDRVSGWDVHYLNEKMIEMLWRDCKSTAEKIANDSIARELEKHRIFMSSFSDGIMQLANVAMLYRVMTIEPAEVKEDNYYKTSEGEGGSDTELFLPDEFYDKNLPSQVAPGTKYLPKYDEFGNVKQIKMYDDYGREIGWVDYTNHGYGNINSPDYHTVPHWHERIYNSRYRDGMKINHRTDTNTPLGDK